MGRPLADREIVADAKRGDRDAFEQLVRVHQGIAFRTAYVIAGSAADAEEAVQDAFVKAYRALGRFREGAPFRPWLLAIVANEARNRRRSAARRARFELHLAEERPSADAAPSPRRRSSPASSARAARRARDAGGGAAAGRRLPLPPRAVRARDRGGARLPARDGQVAALARARAAGGGAVSELETRLAELRVEWPPEPDVAARVRARLEAEPRGAAPGAACGPRGGCPRAARARGGGVAAVPSARSAVLRWLGIEGVRIERVPEAPTPAPTASPRSTSARARRSRAARWSRARSAGPTRSTRTSTT